MGQFKPMVKMETTEPSVELKLKNGGHVNMKKGGKAEAGHKKMAMGGGAMDMMMGTPALVGRPAVNAPVRAPGKPSMSSRRKAMMAKKPMPAALPMAMPPMKKGGNAEMSKMKGLEKELKSHESKPASKGHKGLATGGVLKSTKPANYATGGVVNGQGGYKKGGAIASVIPESVSAKGGEGYKNTKMDTAHPNHNSAPTGEVKLGNGGGYKKGGATKKHYATGGAVNNSGHAVAMPAKKPSAPVSNDRQSGTFKKGGSVTPAQKKEQSAFKAENATAMKQAKAQSNLKYQDGGKVTDLSKGAYDKSIGPSESDMDMAKAIRNIPSKLYEGAKSLFTSKEKPSGSVTKTEKSVTVTPAKKRGGSVKC